MRDRQSAALLRATADPASLTPRDVLQLQRVVGNRAVTQLLARTRPGTEVPAKKNRTGLPDALKAGVEKLSGVSLDDVRVFYNSPEPARFQALAYTRGTDIHVAPGQESHLPHEAWHVVQQKEGRVQADASINHAAVNTDPSLEGEADRFGVLASRAEQASAGRFEAADGGSSNSGAAQRRTAGSHSGEGVLQMVGGWEIRDQPGVIDNNTVQEAVYSQRKANRKPTTVEKDDVPAYIANIPAVAGNALNLATVANKYRNEAFANQGDADLRLAMVFGVNRYRDAQGNTEATMTNTRNNFAAHLGNFNHFPVAAVSFLWDPIWSYQNVNRTMTYVRNAFQQGGQAAQDIAATQTAKFQPGHAQRVVPYGEIRDRIKNSNATSNFQARLSQSWPEVYVHTGDADVTSLRVTDAPASPHQFNEAANTGLFELLDNKMRVKFTAAQTAARNDALQHGQQNPHLTTKQAKDYFKQQLAHHMQTAVPDVITGGYDFRLPPGSNAGNTSVDAYFTMLASRLDFTVRHAMSTKDSRLIYYPEPNTFFRASAYLSGSFGSGPEEGQQMIDSLLGSNLVSRQKMGLLQGAAVGTDPARFSVGLGGGMVNVAQLTNANIASLFNLTQSHARRATWADALERVAANYGGAIATGPLQQLYDAAFPHRMTNGSAVAINALNDQDIDQSVDNFLNVNAIYSDNIQKKFLKDVARASGKAVLAFLKSLIANWPGA